MLHVLVCSLAFIKPLGQSMERRSVIISGTTAFLPEVARAEVVEEVEDPYAKWSFFGIAPPPIERNIDYDEFVNLANENKIETIQIAVQHDCVIATTREGHRLALLIKDRYVPMLLTDTLRKNELPFTVLPIDKSRQQIRDVAQATFYGMVAYLFADLYGWIPWDTTPYGSISERQKAIEDNTQVKTLKERLKRRIEKEGNNTFNATASRS